MQSRRGDPSKRQEARLVVIAPKNDGAPPPGQTRNESATPSPVEAGSSRARLPPRSRTGCWTCRGRKVKCDELRPTCGQCARLQHPCDYNPRLAFRDDTPRVVERMQEVSTEGSSVWDQTRSREGSQPSAPEDSLPPFAALTNDEDRERKAETKEPGTFHVVINPDSFSGLAEYGDQNVQGDDGPSDGARSESNIQGSRDLESEVTSSIDLPEDPNVVILKSFEDPVKRVVSTQPMSSKSPSSPEPSLTLTTDSQAMDGPTVTDYPTTQGQSLLEIAQHGGQDAQLLRFYRKNISCQITGQRLAVTRQVFGPRLTPMEDLFEVQAAKFPPLYHSLMAFSALSLAYRERKQNQDALQHYQQALPSLRSTLRTPNDQCTDGALYTHFILLLYEIAAAEQRGANLWLHHLQQLLRIALMRRELYGQEPQSFIIWFICVIDMYGLLSASSNGEFITTLMEHGMVPEVEEQLPPLVPGHQFYPDEEVIYPLVLRIKHKLVILASQLGQLARKLRGEAREIVSKGVHGQESVESSIQDDSRRRRQVEEVRNALKQAWADHRPKSIPAEWINSTTLPPRVRASFEFCSTLYHACLIYSHSSMWRGQRVQATPAEEIEIEANVTQIVEISQQIVSSSRTENRFVVFPLFLAGFASTGGDMKMRALELISDFEKSSLGRNATTIRQLMQEVYQRQNQSLMNIGHALHVDWVEVMMEAGLQVVNFGP